MSLPATPFHRRKQRRLSQPRRRLGLQVDHFHILGRQMAPRFGQRLQQLVFVPLGGSSRTRSGSGTVARPRSGSKNSHEDGPFVPDPASQPERIGAAPVGHGRKGQSEVVEPARRRRRRRVAEPPDRRSSKCSTEKWTGWRRSGIERVQTAVERVAAVESADDDPQRAAPMARRGGQRGDPRMSVDSHDGLGRAREVREPGAQIRPGSTRTTPSGWSVAPPTPPRRRTRCRSAGRQPRRCAGCRTTGRCWSPCRPPIWRPTGVRRRRPAPRVVPNLKPVCDLKALRINAHNRVRAHVRHPHGAVADRDRRR